MKTWSKLLLLLVGLAALVAVYLGWNNPATTVMWRLRLPRLLLALLCGGVLAGVGLAWQTFLNNPLAEPYILGVSSGAAVGSSLAATAGLFALMPVFGFSGALLAMSLVWALAGWSGEASSQRLVLAGIICGMFFSAVVSLLLYLNSKEAASILGVIMGNLGRVFSHSQWRWFWAAAVSCVAGLAWLGLRARALMLVSLGEATASGAGVNVKRLRAEVFVIGSLLTGVVTAYAGIIGFVGLVVPHLVRLAGGHNLRRLYVPTVIAGAAGLLLCDFVAMHIALVEIPVGVVTAFIGAPFFAVLLVKR